MDPGLSVLSIVMSLGFSVLRGLFVCIWALEEVGIMLVLECSGLESEEGVTLLRQPLGSEVVLAATLSRNLILWRYEPFAAFRTFMASGRG